MRITIFGECAARPVMPGCAAVRGAVPALAALLAMTFASCVKSKLYDTPHPHAGVVEITADWSGREQGAERPASYVVRLGEKTFPAQMDVVVLPEFFTPGAEDLYVYNQPAGMTIDGLKFTVDAAAGGATIEPLPGRLYTFAQEVAVQKDDTVRIAAPMRPRTRGLRFELTVTEGDLEYIRAVRGVLRGVARTFDMAASALADEAATAPAFLLDGDKVTASAHLLGVVPGAKQMLELTFVYTDEKEHTVYSDLSSRFADFGSEMTRTLVLTGNIHAPTAVAPTTTITDWESGFEGGSSDVVAD